MFDFLTIVKAMSDENRIRMLMALRGKELCVCTLSELLNLAPSTTSKHLSILKQARLIESVKDGKFVYYRLTVPESKNYAMVSPAIKWMEDALCDSQQVETDETLLKAIIEKGEQAAGPENRAVSKDHKLYRHVPGIHAIGVFEK